MFADVVFGTNMAWLFKDILSEYILFISTILIDAAMLPLRIFSYVIWGVNAAEGQNPLALDSNARAFWVFKQLYDFVYNICSNFMSEFVKDPSVEPIYEGGKYLYEKTKLIFNYFLSLATKVAEAAVKVGKYVYKNGNKLIKGAVKKALPYVKSAVNTLYGRVSGFINGAATPQIGGPSNMYDAFTVCSLMGISLNQLKDVNNQFSKYALERPLNKYELLHVVYHLDRDLKRPLLRF
tara:strand:- start:118 stop:828 length:711 start_codon:yes stop_codon:yes gene_type:complete